MIHKRNKHYLISIFIHNVRGHPYPIPPPPPPSRAAISCLQRCVSISCGHFRSHFGQNVIGSLSMPMVSNRPNSFLVIVFTQVIGPQNHNIILVRSYNRPMDGLVIQKQLHLHSEWKQNCTFIPRKKKLYSGVNPSHEMGGPPYGNWYNLVFVIIMVCVLHPEA